jgi:hypothetical protein
MEPGGGNPWAYASVVFHWFGPKAMTRFVSFGAFTRVFSSLTRSIGRSRARCDKSPSATAWIRQAMRFCSQFIFPAVIASPNTSMYLSLSSLTVIASIAASSLPTLTTLSLPP